MGKGRKGEEGGKGGVRKGKEKKGTWRLGSSFVGVHNLLYEDITLFVRERASFFFLASLAFLDLSSFLVGVPETWEEEDEAEEEEEEEDGLGAEMEEENAEEDGGEVPLREGEGDA